MLSLQEFLLKAGQTVTLVGLEPFESLDNVVALFQKAECLPLEKRIPLPRRLEFLARRIPVGQRDAALQVGILFDYAWRIISFIVLTILVEHWPIVGVLINLLGIYLIIDSVQFLRKYFSSKELEEAHKKSAITTQNFWWVVVKMELLNIVFSADSFATAWAITHDRTVLIIATLVGVAFTRFGVKLAKPIVQERWHPAITIGIYTLIGVVGMLLVVEIPLQLFLGAEIPEPAKIAAVFIILAPFITWAEVAYHRRKKNEFRNNPARKYSIQPVGPVLGGHIDGEGNALFLLAKEDLKDKKVNTVLILDGSLSCAKFFLHAWGNESVYEVLMRYFGSALASIDTDGAVHVYITSMGDDGKEIRLLGIFTGEQFQKGVKVPSNLPFGEVTDLAYALRTTESSLVYPGVERLHGIVLSDGRYEDEQFQSLQLVGLDRVAAMKLHSMVDNKLYFIVPRDAEEGLGEIDNLPGTTQEDPDPFEVYGYKDKAEALQLVGHILDEALHPSQIASIPVRKRIRIFAGKEKKLAYDSGDQGAFGVVTAKVDPGTKLLFFELDGQTTPIVVGY